MKLVLLFFSSLLFISCQTTQKTSSSDTDDSSITLETEALPASDLRILDHKYFVIMYDTKYRLARSVIYTLTEDQIKATRPGTRKNSFRQDPLLKDMKKATVKVDEYAYSDYDKGHLANSADFTQDDEANRATFVMSNMVPQKGPLNRESWGSLEEKVRLWACGEKKITVISGPVLKPGLPTLLGGLPIPQEFYKIVLDETPPKKMLAFIYKQTDTDRNIEEKRLVDLTVLKKKILHQMDKAAFANYPVEPISTWKSEDCVPKAKTKGKKVARKHEQK